jgi:hypothetical protein
MPIKYAEITTIINLEKETMMNYFNRLIGNENKTSDHDTVIILFDDETIFDVKRECTNNTKYHKLMEMGPTGSGTLVPLYFEKKCKKETFFYKTPHYNNNGEKRLDFKPIFANNKKHLTTKKEASVYNSIYERGNSEVLSILSIKSNQEKPRFLVAYDDEYFEKEYIICFINFIFSME